MFGVVRDAGRVAVQPLGIDAIDVFQAPVPQAGGQGRARGPPLGLRAGGDESGHGAVPADCSVPDESEPLAKPLKTSIKKWEAKFGENMAIMIHLTKLQIGFLQISSG